jgi:hypothetical protein
MRGGLCESCSEEEKNSKSEKGQVHDDDWAEGVLELESQESSSFPNPTTNSSSESLIIFPIIPSAHVFVVTRRVLILIAPLWLIKYHLHVKSQMRIRNRNSGREERAKDSELISICTVHTLITCEGIYCNEMYMYKNWLILYVWEWEPAEPRLWILFLFEFSTCCCLSSRLRAGWLYVDRIRVEARHGESSCFPPKKRLKRTFSQIQQSIFWANWDCGCGGDPNLLAFGRHPIYLLCYRLMYFR